MAEKSAISEFLGQFNSKIVKQDETRKTYLVEHLPEVKLAVPLESDKGKQLLRKYAKRAEFRLVGSHSVKEACDEVEAIAWDYEQPLIKPQIRYGTVNKESVTIDLMNGSVVQLSAEGVEVLESIPAYNDALYFSRPNFQLPMVMPKLPCENTVTPLKKLRKFINTDDSTFFLLVAYMTYLMAHPKEKGVPYPILMIQGEKGAGKSFFCNNILRGLLDPSAMPLLAFPNKQEDFIITINGMFLAVFDNLRTLKKSQSDLLCTTATKGITAKRTLYTTSDLTVMELHSPLVLNGIHDFVQESDLASRCLRVCLDPMKDGERREELVLKEELAEAMPEIFGALLTLASKGLAALPDVEVKHQARMMDFSKWIGALEKVWGVEGGKLQKAYQLNVKSLMASGTADDSLTIALQKLLKQMVGGKVKKFTPSQLLSNLQLHEDSMYLPKGAAALTAKLKGQESSLNANGIYFKFGRDAERYIMVSSEPIS
ncbi:ATP-binding protein [Vibrio sp. PID17_43]|uniref:ATP-binding protein n=1 Tax=Vibrio sp. PID17_43 TaxID=1583451 RepID=UPI000C000AD0|nr:ATP-binding protein [Vibrio sp. PID17_43]PHJ41258.1 ATP-binding protein [Vibrio sp. PID17_43]